MDHFPLNMVLKQQCWYKDRNSRNFFGSVPMETSLGVSQSVCTYNQGTRSLTSGRCHVSGFRLQRWQYKLRPCTLLSCRNYRNNTLHSVITSNRRVSICFLVYNYRVCSRSSCVTFLFHFYNCFRYIIL